MEVNGRIVKWELTRVLLKGYQRPVGIRNRHRNLRYSAAGDQLGREPEITTFTDQDDYKA